MLMEQLKRATHSHRNVFLSVLVLIGFIAVYNWVVAPHRNYLKAAQKCESAVDNLAKKKHTINTNLRIKNKELNELQEKLNFNLELFFDPIETRAFFSGIKAVTGKAGCMMYSLTFSSNDSASGTGLEGTNSFIIARGIRLSVLGGYGNIEALMNKLQAGSKHVLIDSLRIYSDNENPGYLKCDMNVTIYEIQRKDDHQND